MTPKLILAVALGGALVMPGQQPGKSQDLTGVWVTDSVKWDEGRDCPKPNVLKQVFGFGWLHRSRSSQFCHWDSRDKGGVLDKPAVPFGSSPRPWNAPEKGNLSETEKGVALILSLRVDEADLNGSVAQIPHTGGDIEEGRISGNKLEFKVYQRIGPLRIFTTYKGELSGKDELRITRFKPGGASLDRTPDGSLSFRRISPEYFKVELPPLLRSRAIYD